MAKNFTLFCLVHLVLVAVLFSVLRFVLPNSICYYYSALAHVFLGGIIAYQTFSFSKKAFFDRRLSLHKKSVLITGCDRGFGFNLAKKLDSKGFQVFASCLFPAGEGAQTLKQSCSSSLHILGLDVTKDESVEKALCYVKENLNDTEFWAVVNNAGILSGFGIEWTTLKYFQDSIEVNAMGVVRVTKAFLPLIRRSKGRIVTITSAIIHFPVPNFATYVMSKYAVSGFCECLRQEMRPWGVKAITIEPEAFRTGLFESNARHSEIKELMNSLDKDTRREYGENYFKAFMNFLERIYNEQASEKFNTVVALIEDALTLEEPSDVYKPRVSLFHRFVYKFGEHLPQPVLDILFRFGLYYLFDLPYPEGATHRF